MKLDLVTRLTTAGFITLVSITIAGCDGSSSSGPQVPFQPMAVYLADTSSCLARPPNRAYAQATFFRLPENRTISYSIGQRDAQGNTVTRQRAFQRGALYMGGRDSIGAIRGEMWFFDLAVSQRIADPGHPECPWVGFDVAGPPRAEGKLAFDQETAKFHLVGGIEGTQNGGERTADTALSLDALLTPFANWANLPNWNATTAIDRISDQIEAQGSELCAATRNIHCRDLNTGYEYWSYDVESCSAQYESDVFECVGDQQVEQVPVGYHQQACANDPACLVQPGLPVCQPQEQCGRIPAGSEPAAWSWEYIGRGRSAIASAFSQQDGAFTLFGGHSGCIGPDCIPTEKYPLFLSSSESLQNRSTVRIDQWDARNGGVRSSLASADATRISSAGADWLGYQWVALTGRWELTGTPYAVIAGGSVLEEMAFRWEHVPETVWVPVNPEFNWEHMTGDSEWIKHNSSVGPPGSTDLRERVLTWDGRDVQAVRIPGLPELTWPAVAAVDETTFLIVGGLANGNRSAAIYKVDLRSPSGPVEAIEGAEPLTRVERAQSGPNTAHEVAGAQLVVDPINRYAYVFGGSFNQNVVNVIDYDQSLLDEPHRLLPVDAVPDTECGAPADNGFKLESTVRIEGDGSVHYEATQRVELDCVTSSQCYVSNLVLNLGRGHAGPPYLIEVDVEVYIPNPNGTLPQNPTHAEPNAPFTFAPPGPSGEPRITLYAPDSEPWPNRSQVHVTMRYQREKFQISTNPNLGAGIRPLTAAENCQDPADAPDMCAFYLRSIPFFFEGDTMTLSANGNEQTTPIQDSNVFVDARVQVPAGWGVSVPGHAGTIGQVAINGATYDEHPYTLIHQINDPADYPPPRVVANQHLRHQLSTHIGTSNACNTPNQYWTLDSMVGPSSQLEVYLIQTNASGGTHAEWDLQEIVNRVGDLPVSHTRVFFLPKPVSNEAGFNAADLIEVMTHDAAGLSVVGVFENVVVHELTHHWFGTSPEVDFPAWVAEGLSNLMEDGVRPWADIPEERFSRVLNANISGSACNVSHLPEPDYHTPGADVLFYEVGPYNINMFFQLAVSGNAFAWQQDMWNFWRQRFPSGDFSTADVLTEMDSVVPRFSSNYAPSTPNCPGVPILTLREFEYREGSGATAEEQWLNGSGEYILQQVQQNDYQMPVFDLVPYSLDCIGLSVAQLAYRPEQEETAFTQCHANRVDPSGLGALMSRSISTTPTTEVVHVFETFTMTNDLEVHPLTINPGALTGSGTLVSPVPTQVRLIQAPGLHLTEYAALSNTQTWCSESKDPNCTSDNDGDHSPTATDCYDFDIPGSGFPSAAAVNPFAADSSASDYDLDCNCIGLIAGGSGGHGWLQLDALGNRYFQCRFNF